jgi:putative transposase
MELINRKVSYRLYPTPRQEAALLETKRLHQQLYNAAIQERRDAYRLRGISVSYTQQCRGLTQLRAEAPEYEALNAQSCQVTLKRLDEAFGHFFRRLKEKQKKAGYPRFKSISRFKGWGYKTRAEEERQSFLRKQKRRALQKLGLSRAPAPPSAWMDEEEEDEDD